MSSSTLTPGSPRKPSARPSVCSSTSVEHARRAAGRAPGATRAAWSGVGDRDVRVEARARGGDRVDRDRRAGREAVLLAVRGDRARDVRRASVRVRRAEVRAAARRARRSRRRRPRAGGGSTAAPSNVWPISVEPTTSPSRFDERAVGLSREGDLRDAGDDERVDEPEEHGERDEQRASAGRSWRRIRRSPSAVTTRSMSLMPTNGAIDAAERRR